MAPKWRWRRQSPGSSKTAAPKLTAGVDKDLGETGGTTGTDLTVHTLAKVDDTWPDGETPAEVSDAVLGRVEGEGRDEVWVDGVTNEAAGGVGVETDHEEEGEVVSVPERFEALVTDLLVCGRVHEHHDEQHEVAGDTTWLGVVNLLCALLANF